MKPIIVLLVICSLGIFYILITHNHTHKHKHTHKKSDGVLGPPVAAPAPDDNPAAGGDATLAPGRAFGNYVEHFDPVAYGYDTEWKSKGHKEPIDHAGTATGTPRLNGPHPGKCLGWTGFDSETPVEYKRRTGFDWSDDIKKNTEFCKDTFRLTHMSITHDTCTRPICTRKQMEGKTRQAACYGCGEFIGVDWISMVEKYNKDADWVDDGGLPNCLGEKRESESYASCIKASIKDPKNPKEGEGMKKAGVPNTIYNIPDLTLKGTGDKFDQAFSIKYDMPKWVKKFSVDIKVGIRTDAYDDISFSEKGFPHFYRMGDPNTHIAGDGDPWPTLARGPVASDMKTHANEPAVYERKQKRAKSGYLHPACTTFNIPITTNKMPLLGAHFFSERWHKPKIGRGPGKKMGLPLPICYFRTSVLRFTH